MTNDLAVKVDLMRYPGSTAEVPLIRDFDFRASPGSVTSFLGPSGIGKTTLLRIIGGLERRYVGEVLLGGAPHLTPSRAIQMVFQDYRALPWMDVYNNVKFGAGGIDPRRDEEKIERWLRVVGLHSRQKAWPRELSGGEIGRLAFARAFVDTPRVLMLDEPFKNLDLVMRYELRDELRVSLKAQPTTTLLVSHCVEDAVYLSDMIHILTGPPMQIAETVSITLSHPRDRTNSTFQTLSSDILDRILSLKNTTLTRKNSFATES